MRLTVGNKDISELVEKITWSGDTKQVARKITFTIAYSSTDYYLPKPQITEGKTVLLQKDDGTDLFFGLVMEIDKKSSSTTVSYLAYDFLYYILKSDVNAVFDTTPENAARQVATELGVPVGELATTGIHVYMPCLGENAYNTIMMGYTAASKQNGKKYIPLIKNRDKLNVIEKGALCGVTLSGDYSLTDSSYKVSLQNMVNKIVITDKDGNVLNTIQEKAPGGGTIQKIYKQEDGKDSITEARALIKLMEQTGSVTALSDTRAVSGYAILIEEPVTGLCGKFYIESDSHTFSNDGEEMQLTLEFKNMMDEVEIKEQSNA